jgi:hypothetical protein
MNRQSAISKSGLLSVDISIGHWETLASQMSCVHSGVGLVGSCYSDSIAPLIGSLHC